VSEKMKVGELTTGVKSELVMQKACVARAMLAKKLSQIDRTKAILKQLKKDLAAIEEMDVEQVDIGVMRY
jgi:hypothetical protein